MSEDRRSADRWRYVKLTLLVWVAMIGLDFFFHGGVFAAIYERDSSFVLAAEDAFRRIPLGYLALLLTSALLVWILGQSSSRGWRRGSVVGLALGMLMSTSSVLGLYSISTASADLLGAWFVAQVIEIALAGAIIGQGLLVKSLRKLTVTVAVGFVLLFIGGIVAQNIGAALIA